MHLVETPENPVPPGALVEELRAVDGVRLRAARWAPEGAARGTVAVFGGRTEFIEKYFETDCAICSKRGFAVAALDWRGQGGSERQLRNPRKGHIDDFSLYERDFVAFVDRRARTVIARGPGSASAIRWAARSCWRSPRPGAARSTGWC